MQKKYFNDPSLLLLIAGNFYCIWYYQIHADAFATVVWIYWFQSITIGLFTFMDLLTIKNFDATDFNTNSQSVTYKNKGCTAWFFLVHYGFFHLGYCIFLLVDFGVRKIDITILLIGVGAFFLESILNFIRQKELEATIKFNYGNLFFMPYLRILPMHLMILLPAFLGWKPSLLFLILKMVADLISYLTYRNMYNKKERVDDSTNQVI